MTAFRPYLYFSFDDAQGTLALGALTIAGMTRPIVDGDGGISKAVVEDSENGVICAINPWLGMQEDDTVTVFLDAVTVFDHTVLADEVDKRLFFFVEAERFVPGWIEECYYLLHRKGETAPDDPSVKLRLRVKFDLPGGPDKEPHLPWHSELGIVQLPDEVIEQGVDAEWAAKGVPMTIARYPAIALRDTVQVKWGSVFLKPFVLEQEHVDGTVPIVVRAEQADILAAGDSNGLPVHYELYDEVWNLSEKWSERTTVGVDAGAWRLDAPIIKQSVNGVIDLKELNQQDVIVQIKVQAPDFQLDDTVTLTWIGTPQTGKPLINTQSEDIKNVPSIMEFEIPYAQVRALAMGSADASYVLTKKDGSPPLSSKREFADVIGDVYAHPAPTIREVLGDILEPDNLYATVDLTYPGMRSGDLVELIWQGTRSNGTPYLHTEPYTVSKNDAEDKRITIYVLGEHISVLANGGLDLWYRVSNDEAAIYGVSESEHLLVKVKAIAATLPAPKVPEAGPDDVLDPSKVFDHVTVRVEYLGTVKDDILRYYWTAISSSISTSDWLPITSVSAGKPVPFRVDARFVTPSIGQYVKVRYTLKHASTGLYSYSQTLNLLIGELVGELPPPKVIQATGADLDPIKAINGVDVVVEYAKMNPELDTVALKWRGTPGAGTSDDLELPAHESGSVSFPLPASVVGANIGKPVMITYDVKRYNFWTESDSLPLNVLTFQDPENELPRPDVPEAVNQVLDLMEFAGNAQVIVDKWPFIALGQRLWLRLEGKTTAGASHTIVLLDGALINQSQVENGLKESLLRTELLKLGHASPATVRCKVTFDGASEESMAVEFPLLPLTVRTRYDYLTPVITKVEGIRGDVPDGGMTRDDEVTVTGTATRGETIELFDADSASMGTAPVGDNGVWSRLIGKLTEKLYRITAKAKYDADPVSSNEWSFTVDFAMTPVIRSVTDSKGPLAEGEMTYDNSVFIEGDASAGEKVQLLDGTTPIITLDVDGKGMWEFRYNSLTVKTYRLTAKALYDVDPISSPLRTFVVAQAVTPTISRVTDIRGDVANGATTYYRSVTLSGKASKNEEIELRDDSALLIKRPVDANGDWTWDFNNLTLKSYKLTAKGLYGNEPVSGERVFSVAAHVSPTITEITDSQGRPVSGTIYDRTVNLKGRATPREKVRIHDNGSPIGSEVNVAASGEWSSSASGLAVGPHSMTAKALYEVSPIESAPRTFTIAEQVAPTLTSVRGDEGEVQNGGQTKSTTVSLTGSVTSGHQVQIYDFSTPKHTVAASGTTWSTTLAVALGDHSITARAVTTGQVSNTRVFKVVSPIPPLQFNTNPVTLSGKIYLIPGNPEVLPNFGPGTSVHHRASGGQPNYSYFSSHPAVAVVDGTGLVTVRGRGTATITVRDAANQSLSYQVTVTGVIHCIGLSSGNWAGINATASQAGCRLPSYEELYEIYQTYSSRWPMPNHLYWSTTPSNAFWPLQGRKTMNPVTSANSSASIAPLSNHHAYGVGLR
ncbi:Ig-like domain repeat protein [Pseudomonas sp. P8_241]|uniref:Ig-like domain repeat protein n=1 Tax=Pseudomonas sp. P8_241 TaxID=3043445 RepID=UPI002A3691D5|nr:Ig-like domain repeat protein [Pseudomonas sp. P8_241]WPN49334.1 Ig-like domain repeat protein [Pseudomonas sp. P8_241]